MGEKGSRARAKKLTAAERKQIASNAAKARWAKKRVTAYTVVRRTPEIGVRMALGAGRGRVIRAVMRRAMLQAAAGLAIGVPVAIFCVRYVKSQLYEVTNVNVPVMVFSIGVLVLAAAISGII